MDFKIGRSRSTVGNPEPAALGNDRVLITRDCILQWKLEGRVFYVQDGDAGTKQAIGETTLVALQPEFAFRVPSGTLMIPLSLSITVEDIAGTENHLIWSTTTNDIGAGTSTTLYPVNYRRDCKYGASVQTNTLYTGNASASTGLIEVKRWYHPFASAAVTDGTDLHHHVWTYKDPDMPILVGPATLQLHWYGGTAMQGFMEHTWVEMAASEMGL